MSSKDSRSMIEAGLEQMYPAADRDFLEGLEATLLTQATEHTAKSGSAGRSIWAALGAPLRRRTASLALGLVVVLTMLIGIFTPQRVFGAVLWLLGGRVYVPGVGIVDANTVRVLAAPVEASRDGVTVRVVSVIAKPDITQVVVEVEGMAYEDQIPYILSSYLLLPDGTAIGRRLRYIRTGFFQPVYEFAPLPAGVFEFELVWEPWTKRRAGDAGDWWQDTSQALVIPLTLVPGENLDTPVLPQAYALADASDTHYDITLEVLEVIQGLKETVLRLYFQWPGKFNSVYVDTGGGMELRSAHGEVFEHNRFALENQIMVVDTKNNQAPVAERYSFTEQTLVFEPGAPDARQLTLQIDRVSVWLDALEISFELDLGADPQVGDTWPLDVWFEAAGVPVHIVSARLVESTFYRRETNEEVPVYALEFSVGPRSDQGNHFLLSIDFSSIDGVGNLYGDYYEDEKPHGYVSTLRVPLKDAEHEMPTGVITVRVDSVDIELYGPWVISWEVPNLDNPTSDE
ncbi:MAG: hypothetical protein OEZ02_01625 [Anaerolineae bacterium]|nr:hypothetical protein [Anaerolineae bacterium]